MNFESVVVCGDSFGCGIGLSPERAYEDYFGGLVSKELNLPLRVFARSGCCNFTIYLQVKEVIEQYKGSFKKPLVLISMTYHERYMLPISDQLTSSDLDIKNVQYLEFEPYSETSNPQRKLEFDVKKESKLSSQTLTNIMLYLKDIPSGSPYNSLKVIDLEKYKLFLNSKIEINDSEIKKEYDNAILTKAHILLKNEGIPHILMSTDLPQFLHIDQDNVAIVDWGHFCMKYPDNIGSGHCDEMGHKEVFNILLPKIEKLINYEKNNIL